MRARDCRGSPTIRPMPFVLVTLAFCALFALVRELQPWWLLSVAGWSITGWLVMAVFASVLGLFLA